MSRTRMTSTRVDALDTDGAGLPSTRRRFEMQTIVTPLGDRIWHEDYSGPDPTMTARVYRAEAMFARTGGVPHS